MSLESDLFERLRPVEEKLISYGFVRTGTGFQYEKEFMDGVFLASVLVKEGRVSGRVIDLFSNEEYVPVHLTIQTGSFAAGVRREYLKILEEIAGTCFVKGQFLSAQADRIVSLIGKEFNDVPEYLFEKFPGWAVVRHAGSGKWYAVLLDTEIQDETGSRHVQLIDLHCPLHSVPEDMRTGVMPAFHMNKKTWLSVIADESCEDEQIMDLVRASWQSTETAADRSSRKIWLIPANPSYFDLDHAFSVSDVLHWKQSASMKPGDIVFIYCGSPQSEIRFQCEVLETEIPFKGVNDGPVHFEKLMKIRMIRKFEDHGLSREMMQKCGVQGVRGARSMPEPLLNEIYRIYGKDNEDE
ncbi:MAG: MmcQ/YjbR family DNA-binding protein [Solobacterium sp.]|nr:MmcQ/YjbR family DNA-binding protein [Solobacterium sp.]